MNDTTTARKASKAAEINQTAQTLSNQFPELTAGQLRIKAILTIKEQIRESESVNQIFVLNHGNENNS